MKRIYLLLIGLVLLTGCSSTVNISIDKNTITEKVKISESNYTKYNQIKNWNGFPAPLFYDQELNVPTWMPNREKESGVSYYEVSENNSNKTLEITGSFSLKNHNRSSLVRNCFRFYNVITEGQKTIFSTSKGLTCSYRNFSVVVSTPYVVLNNNADGVDKEHNTYTWNINSSNAKKVGIYMEVDFSKKYNEDPNETINEDDNKSAESNYYTYLIVGILIVLLALLGVHLYNKKRNLSDK